MRVLQLPVVPPISNFCFFLREGLRGAVASVRDIPKFSLIVACCSCLLHRLFKRRHPRLKRFLQQSRAEKCFAHTRTEDASYVNFAPPRTPAEVICSSGS